MHLSERELDMLCGDLHQEVEVLRKQLVMLNKQMAMMQEDYYAACRARDTAIAKVQALQYQALLRIELTEVRG